MTSHPPRFGVLSLVPPAAAAASLALGAVVLAEWSCGTRFLTGLVPGLGAMGPNTAAAFVLLGAALGCEWRARSTGKLRWLGRALAGVVLLWAAVTVGEHEFHWGLDIDQMPAALLGRLVRTPLSGRSPFASALCFLLLSGALLLLAFDRQFALAQSLAIIAGLVSLLALTAFAYRAIGFEAAAMSRPLAIHSVLLFGSLAVALLCLRPDQAFMNVIHSEDLGGMLARRLLPMAIMTPVVVGWFRVEGQRAGLYGTEVGSALFAMVTVACFTTLILWSATTLHITDGDRRRAEAALRESAGRFHAVFENMSEGVVIAQLDGRLLYWNRTALDIHGFTNSEEFSRHLPEQNEVFELSTLEGTFVSLEDWPMSRLLRGERLRNLQLRVRRRDRDWDRVFRYGGDAVLDAAGNRVAFLTVSDITETVQAEVALRESRGMLQAVLDNVPHGIFWKDRSSRYLGCNQVVARSFGLSRPEEIVGRLDADLQSLTPAQADFFVLKDREVMEADASQFHIVESLTRADGTTIWIETNKIPLHDDHGAVNGVLGTWEDITDRKRAQEAIVNYNERLKLLHQIDLALIAEEKPETIAAAALPLLREMLGVRRAIVSLIDLESGMVEWLAAAGPHRVRVGPGVRFAIRFLGDVAALQRGELQVIDVHTLPAGPEVDALLASEVHCYLVVPMIAGEQLIGALSLGEISGQFSAEQIDIAREAATQFAVAITQSRLHERVRRHAEELEVRVRDRTQELETAHAKLQENHAELVQLTADLQVANKELEAFSYSVSHDLRAPLRAIDGFSRIVLEDHAAQLPEEGRSYLEDIRANTLQMGRLVDDLLAFSRLGRHPVKKQTIELAPLVHQCLGELERSRDGRQIEIRVGSLPPAQADPALLKQVWLNLLTNALKYTSRVPSAQIEIGCLRDGERPVYFIKDNGVGFDMRYAHKLFGVFQRLHRAEDYEGTGVGLAIVQRVIHRHGGRVWAEAQVDRGATFFFTLESGETVHA